MITSHHWRRGLLAASLLPVLATTTSQATPVPAPDATGSACTFKWVDAKTVPPAQVEHLSSPQPFADYLREHTQEPQVARPRQPSPTSKPDALKNECSPPVNTDDTTATTGRGTSQGR